MHTEMSNATPGQRPSLLAPRKDSNTNETSAPTGVDALNTAMCFLHSGRGSDIDNNDVVSASAVGAEQFTISRNDIARSKGIWIVTCTFVYHQSEKHDQRQPRGQH